MPLQRPATKKKTRKEKCRVPAGKYVYSASQLKTFDRCERKWAFEKIEGFRPPPNKSQELGTRVHKVIEDYLSGEVDTFDPKASREHRIAAPGQVHWPEREAILGVEPKLSLKIAGSPFTGYIDVDAYEEHPLVIDHKTTSDFHWMLDEEGLHSDIQQRIYAADALQRHPHEEKFTVRWIYYLTRGQPEARVTQLTLHAHEVQENLIPVEDLVRRMEQARFADKANDLRPNVEACADYGGCPHRDRCERSPLAVFGSLWDQMDRRKAQKEREMERRKPKMPPPRAEEAAQPRQGLDPQAMLDRWPDDAENADGSPGQAENVSLPQPRKVGTIKPRKRPQLREMPATVAAAVRQVDGPKDTPTQPEKASAPSVAPRPTLPQAERPLPARPVLPPEAPKDVQAQKELSEAQLKVIESDLGKPDKEEMIHEIAERHAEGQVEKNRKASDDAAALVREKLREKFGDKATKDMKAAYLQLLASCIHAGRDLSYADRAMESYFDLFGK